MPHPFRLLRPEEQLADEMRRRIRVGEWADTIPGLHRLVAEFGAGRAVTERAITTLLDTGELLPPTGAGRPVRIARRGKHRFAAGTVLAHATPPDMVSGDGIAVLRALEPRLPAPVFNLRFDTDTPTAERLHRIRETRAKHVVLVSLEATIADTLRDDGRHVVALGAIGKPARAPLIAADYAGTIRAAFARAFAAGHRRVSFPLWRRAPETVAMIREQVGAAYAAAGLRHSPAFDTPIVSDDSPDALHDCIRELFRATPPTALVLNDFIQWVGVTSTLARLRLVVPDDVSLILLTHAPELAAANPSAAHFRFPVPALVEAVCECLDAPPGNRAVAAPHRAFATLPVAGDSLSPPRARPRV